jgi:NADH-quinone oxidoreductase subunit I
MIGMGMLRGMGVTMRVAIRGPVTVQYPDRRVGLLGAAKRARMGPFTYVRKHPVRALKATIGLATVRDRIDQDSRFRGQDFNWYVERCTGCASCAKFCPLGIIKIETSASGQQSSEGEVYNIDVFDIDIGRCMFCGICVEACPYDALHMGSDFERGNYRRQGLVLDSETLTSKKKTPSTWFRPQMEAQGYDPHSGDVRPWDEAGRHEQPSPEDLNQKWVEDR